MNAKFLLVLMSPMTKAMERMQWAHLHEAGIPQTECGVVYLLNGEQPDGAKDTPSKSQIDRLEPKFRAAMLATTPRVIIPVGPETFRAVTGLSGHFWSIDEARGYAIPPTMCRPRETRVQVEVGTYKTGPRKGTTKMGWTRVGMDPPIPESTEWIVPTLSWKQYVKGRRRQVSAVQAALETAASLARGEAPVEPPSGDCTLMCGLGLAVAHGVPLAFDLEAPMNSHAIERFSVGFRDHQLGVVAGTFPWTVADREYLGMCLDRSSVNVAHNIQYDEPQLRKNGLEVREPWWDTMICHSLLEPDIPKGLGKCAPLYVRTTPWKHLANESAEGYNDPVYSRKDAFIEHAIYEEQVKALEEWGMTELFTKRIMPSVKALIDLREQGLRLDPPVVEHWCGVWQRQLTEHLAWWDGQFPGYPAVGPGSAQAIHRLLYKTWGLPVQRNKDDGATADALAIRTLMELAPQYAEPLGRFLQIRGVAKLISTYGNALIGNERVYPSYLPTGKDEKKDDQIKGKALPGTGRLACSGPNIQNQPDESKVMYIPDEDGWVWVAADYSQAELRQMAAKSDDAALKEALKGDVHARTMELIPGISRVLAKNGVYGTSFGAGAPRLVNMLRENGVYVTVKAMKDLQAGLSNAYPRWWAYLQSQGAVGVAQGYLRNSFGRVRRFTGGGGDVPAMKDFGSQSDVGDVGWSTYRQLWEGAQRAGGRLSILVHDEVVVQCPPDRVGAVSEMLRDVMCQRFDNVAPGFWLPIDIRIGPRWSKKDMIAEGDWK